MAPNSLMEQFYGTCCALLMQLCHNPVMALNKCQAQQAACRLLAAMCIRPLRRTGTGVTFQLPDTLQTGTALKLYTYTYVAVPACLSTRRLNCSSVQAGSALH
jgi:hypothetical protein